MSNGAIMRSGACALGLLVVSPVLAPLAHAQTPPREGSFDVIIEQRGSWEGFPIGHEHWVWIARREGEFHGSGLLDGLSSRCVSKGKTLFGVLEAEIHCESTDADGDKIYDVSTEECACGPGGRGGGGTGEFIGGTGKYRGIRGTFEVERRVGERDYDARTWTDHVRVRGRWRLP